MISSARRHESLAASTRERGSPQVLARTGRILAGPLHDAVDRLSPDLQRVVAYHFGWRDPEGRPLHAAGGKAIRPAITLLATEAAGGQATMGLPGAVAIELVHNFSLLHDDVMDGDRERRHRPTVWALFGVGHAIVAGDAMLTLAHQVLLDDRRVEGRRAARELAAATAEMIQGQAEDLAFESRVDVTEKQCLAMSGHKTGALLACAAAMGAMLGGGGDRAVAALRSFGRHVGLAFQAVDDVLGIWGHPAVTGKPVASDLRQHKKTIPIVHALARGGAEARNLAALMSNGTLGENDVATSRALDLLDAAGSRGWTLGLAQRHLSQAMAALEGAGLRREPAGELRAIGEFIVRRDS